MARAYATMGEHAELTRRLGPVTQIMHVRVYKTDFVFDFNQSFRKVSRPLALLKLFLSGVNAGDWKNASSHLERSALATASQYGEDSIELGHQLFKLAQLHFNG